MSIEDNDPCIHYIKEKGILWVEKLLDKNLTYTKPGSISHLLYGKKPSEQSINIKIGRFGEFISKELIKHNPHLELLTCGVQLVGTKNKDIDLVFKDNDKQTLYYRELKGNIELDTEKLPATVNKCKEIHLSLQTSYPDYTIDYGILNWSVYNRQILTAGLYNIRTFEHHGIKIDHMEDFLHIVQIPWEEEDYYAYFREIGKMIGINNF